MKRTLRERRERLGLTRQALAQIARVSISRVTMIEGGKGHSVAKHLVRSAIVAEELRRRCETRREAQLVALWGATDGRLKSLMLDHAWRLLDECRFDQADAVLEVLPRADAEALLFEFFKDDLGGSAVQTLGANVGACNVQPTQGTPAPPQPSPYREP